MVQELKDYKKKKKNFDKRFIFLKSLFIKTKY